jgi:hypothetical protein
MNLIALRIYSPLENTHYEIIIHWPSLELHEVFAVQSEDRSSLGQNRFVWSMDMQLQEIRVDPILFPKNLALQLVQSIHTHVFQAVEPIIFQGRL